MSEAAESSVREIVDVDDLPAGSTGSPATARPTTEAKRSWAVAADPGAGSKDRFAPIPEVLATPGELEGLRGIDDSAMWSSDVAKRPVRAGVALAASVGLDGRPFDRLTLAVERWAASRDQLRSVVVHGIPAGNDDRLHVLPAANPLGLAAVVGDAEAAVIPGDPALVMACRDRGRVPIVMPRRPELAECDDDREVRFAEKLAAQGWATLAMSSSVLFDALDGRLEQPERRKAVPARSADDIADLVAYWARVTVSERNRERRAL